MLLVVRRVVARGVARVGWNNVTAGFLGEGGEKLSHLQQVLQHQAAEFAMASANLTPPQPRNRMPKQWQEWQESTKGFVVTSLTLG